jgi:hypothetical protein
MKSRNARLAIVVSVLLAVGLAIIGLVARGQAPPVSRAQNSPSGRFVIYYHPQNFNQALLLDTSTGAVWRLETMYVVSPDKSKPDKASPQYESFQRLTVEGFYHSSDEEKAIDQATPKTDADKDYAPAK